MCETRSAVSMLEKCIRKPSRNPHTSVLLQCLAWDKFLKKHSGGWERRSIPVNWNSGRPKLWRRMVMAWLRCSCQIPPIPMEPGETSASCKCSSHVGAWPWHGDGCHLAQSPAILHGQEHSRLSLFSIPRSPAQHNAPQFPLANQFREQGTSRN